jgi:ribosomal protein S18 acetylase RimI-like enzyme
MHITDRPYTHVKDIQPVMSFLRDTYAETGSLSNWLPQRFENSAKENEADIHIWMDGGRIVAVANPEETRRYFLQIHPNYTTLEGEILDWVEEHSKGGILSIVTMEGDKTGEELLRRRGYERGKTEGILRIHDPKSPKPAYQPPDGFKIRTVDPGRDFKELSAAVRTVFGHGEWLNEEVLKAVARMSFYEGELDLVAVDASGAIASFCTFRVDAPGRLAELEPMGTLPKYQGLGLAKALISEGLRRLESYEPRIIFISGAANTPPANRLYEITGFTIKHDFYFWNKTV